MILLLAVIFPLLAALAILLGGCSAKPAWGRSWLLAGAFSHALLCVLAVRLGGHAWTVLLFRTEEWLALDRFSELILVLTSVLFLAVALHLFFWLPAEYQLAKSKTADTGKKPGGDFLPEFIFLPCLLGFLATMTLAISSANLGLLWVAIEATTLVSAPLICFHRSPASLEAMWKYLLICSVGIGLALLGTFFLALAAGSHASLNIWALAAKANALNPQWCKAAFILILAGYGTKMGLAPFHTWLPDAHSEAPGAVSALLSAALLNCSFLGILRFTQIMPQSLQVFCRTLLLVLGFFSLAVAAFFVIRQHDYKRMLAYSSVEHMGLLALLWSCALKDSTMQTATMLHLIGHSLLKMVLFLVAGNILLAYGTRSVTAVNGMFSTISRNAFLFVTALLLVCGTPPSPLFVSELLLVCELGPWLGGLLLVLLFLVSAGMLSTALKMSMGTNPLFTASAEPARIAETLCVLPALSLLLLLLLGGMSCYWLSRMNLWW
ncbi:MAG: proton-conducting transporter membrane subunit [Lentisphaeria bacterium]